MNTIFEESGGTYVQKDGAVKKKSTSNPNEKNRNLSRESTWEISVILV
ncbi:MAG: hypothetical protein IK099_15625 [Clostridia bacterium]|nr:hypothetical protein [Clostridia bacterium]